MPFAARPSELALRCSALLAYLSVISASCVAVGPRLITAGLTSPELSLITSVALELTGVSWQVSASLAPHDGHRLAVFGIPMEEGDEWSVDDQDAWDPIVFSITEALDEMSVEWQPQPVLVTSTQVLSTQLSSTEPAVGSAPAGALLDAALLDAALAAHAARYELATPLPRQPTAWSISDARLVRYVELDGAYVGAEGGSAVGVEASDGSQRWDTSSLLVLDGVVDAALRAELLALLCAGGAHPELGPDPRLWEMGTFTDIGEDDYGYGGGGEGGGEGGG